MLIKVKKNWNGSWDTDRPHARLALFGPSCRSTYIATGLHISA